MLGLSKRIMEHAAAQPEAVPLRSGVLVHLGNHAAVAQAVPGSPTPDASCASGGASTRGPARPAST